MVLCFDGDIHNIFNMGKIIIQSVFDDRTSKDVCRWIEYYGHHLSDPQTEYQIRDRLSFRDFLGLASGDKVPDEKTIWTLKEKLTKKGLFEEDRGGELWNPEEGDTEEEKKRKANKKRQKDMDKLQSFGFFVSYEWIKELILQRCLLILMFNGLRIKAGGSAKK